MSDFTGIPQQVEEALESRRSFLKSAGLLVVSVTSASAQSAGPYPDPNFKQLDSWIVIHQDNTATFYVGKTDCGQGTGTAFRQMMSDELDIAYDKISLTWAAPTSPSIRVARVVRMLLRHHKSQTGTDEPVPWGTKFPMKAGGGTTHF